MRRFLISILLLAVVFSPFLPALRSEADAPRRPDIVIVHTNDLHAHYRSFPDRQGEIRGGVARIAARIDQLREEHGDRLLYLDAGDVFQGTPFYNFYRGALGIELLEAMGCDAMALGNHELDDGPVSFFRASLGASFPVLCANLKWEDGSPLLPSSTLLKAGGMKVSVVGVVSSAMPQLVSAGSLAGLLTDLPTQALRDWLASERPGADLELVLSHCGVGEDREIAANVPEIPLIVGGHSHSFLREPVVVNGVTICQAGCYGYELGVLACYREPDGAWRFEDRLEPVTVDWPESPAVKELIERAGALVDREMEVVLADLPESFDAANKSSVADPLGMLIAEVMRRAAAADVGIQNVGGYRTFLPAGPLRRGRVFELLPFDNQILKLTLSGAKLQELFDYLAASHDSGTFSQTAGASYTISGGRARELRIGGRLIDPGRDYTLAVADFLYGGGDGYTVLASASRVEPVSGYARERLEALLLGEIAPRPSDFPANFRVLP